MIVSSGLFVVDKPAGLTSFQCVRRIRDILGKDERVGHCGTLDPMARGVLVVLFGAATRRQDDFLSFEKQYWFRAQWGITTDTGDRDGKEVSRSEFAHITREALDDAAGRFMGTQLQTPPAYAALKYKGKHYYDWARKGVEIPRAPRSITISKFDVLNHAGDFWDARVICSRGTYIRTLAEDVAKILNSGAHLKELIRERVGPYRREEALSWSFIENATRESLLTHVQQPIDHHAGIV
jgi:tRNA pseudouridine55 synthase